MNDDEAVRREICCALHSWGAARPVATAREALVRVDPPWQWDVILYDLTMAALEGPDFYAVLATEDPAVLERLAFISDGDLDDRVAAFVKENGVRLLARPFEPAALLALVDELTSATT